MDTLLVIATLFLGLGMLSLLLLVYWLLKYEEEPGSVSLLVWSSISASGMILGDTALAFGRWPFGEHVWATILFVLLTLLSCFSLYITLNVRRIKFAPSA